MANGHRVLLRTPSRPRAHLLLSIALMVAPGCMSSPKDGQTFANMGTSIGFIGGVGPHEQVVFEYAVHEKAGSEYPIVGWKKLGTCTTSDTVYTDVQALDWAMCSLVSRLPPSDCTFGGQGAWRGNPGNPNDGQRFAQVRAIGGGYPTFALPVGISESAFAAHIQQHGVLSALIAFNSDAGFDALVSTVKAQFGASNLVGNADTTDIFGRGDRVYITRVAASDSAELAILDVSNPAAPTLLGSLELGATANAVFVEGFYAYVAMADDGGELRVVNIADPTTPMQVVAVPLPGSGPAISVAAVGNSVYVGRQAQVGTEFHVLEHDFANPASVQLLVSREIGADVNAIDATRNIAYLATNHASKEFIALRISSTAVITETGAFGSPLAAGRDVDYHAGRLYGVTDSSSGADVFVLSAPSNGQLTSLGSLRLGTANNGVSVYNKKALVSTNDPAKALTIVDVALPSALATLGSVAAAAPAIGLAVRNGIANVATTGNSTEFETLSPSVQLEPVLEDVNEDEVVTIGCIGDSNTGATCSKVAQCLPSDTGTAPSWCADPGTVWAARPSWQTRDHSTGFGALTPIWGTPTCCVMDGTEQISQALCEDLPFCDCVPEAPVCVPPCAVADAVVFALGTVDTGNAACPGSEEGVCAYDWPFAQGDVESILQVLQAYAADATAASVTPFYTLVAPIRDPLDFTPAECPTWGFDFDDTILRYNNRVRHEVPRELIIDFFSPMVRPGDYTDPLHMTDQAHQKRARAVMSKLKN